MSGDGAGEVRAALAGGQPRRLPFLARLAPGHLLALPGPDPLARWFTSEGAAAGLAALAGEAALDGLVVEVPGRDPGLAGRVRRVEAWSGGLRVEWGGGARVEVLPDRGEAWQGPPAQGRPGSLDELEPEDLWYIGPEAAGARAAGWGREPGEAFFPPWIGETVAALKRVAGEELAVHGRVLSPFSQLLELLGYDSGMALLLAEKELAHACLARLAEGAVDLGARLAAAGAEALALVVDREGGDHLGRELWLDRVLPATRETVAGLVRSAGIPVYLWTGGWIADRLDGLRAAGAYALAGLEAPPAGDLSLEDAARLGPGRPALQGGIDSGWLQGAPSPGELRRRGATLALGTAGLAGCLLGPGQPLPAGAPPASLRWVREGLEGPPGDRAW